MDIDSINIDSVVNFTYHNFYYIGAIFFWMTSVFGLLPTIYQFQIKEYLWYRMSANYRDEGLRLIPNKMPKKSARNLFLWVGASALSLPVFGYVAEIFTGVDYTIGISVFLQFITLSLVAMIVSKVIAFLLMLATQPLANYVRERKILSAKQKLAENENLKRILLTGSYGKTSTKQLFAGLLLKLDKNIQFTKENHNTDLGISLDILRYLEPITETFIAEVGAYNRGHIAKVAGFIKPDVGILTSIGNQHLDTFRSKQNLINAKMELYQGIKSGGVFYYNMDMDIDDLKQVKEIIATRQDVKVLSYSADDETADIFLKSVVIFPEGARIRIEIHGVEYLFNSQLRITHNVTNLAPAIAYSILELGIKPDDLQDAIAQLTEDTGRLRIVHLSSINLLLDDYNSTKEGFISAISEMDHHEGEKVIFSRGIIELGRDRLPTYKEIVDRINSSSAKLYTTDKAFGVGRTSEKKMIEIFKDFVEDEKKYTILVEGRFSPQFNSFIKSLTR